MTFGEKLRELRVSAGYTQEVLAKKLNLSKANISKYEAGTVEPNLTTLIAISKLFQKSTDYLLETFVETAPSVLSSSALKLLGNFNQLNTEGQEKLLDHSIDLVSSGRYIKSDQSSMVSKKA